MTAWSYSGIKKFEQCPKQFYYVKVLKQYTEPSTEATLYGTLFHEAAELCVRDGVPMPEKFSFAKPIIDELLSIKGDKFCEVEMGLTQNLEPCKFNDPDVWWRGVADLVIVNTETNEARVIDYKTSKSAKYADKGQLELMALAVFKHFPKVQKIKAGLLFVVSNDFVKASYTRDDQPRLWEKWISAHAKMQGAFRSNVWNPHPSGLCRKHCVVLDCPHNGRST